MQGSSRRRDGFNVKLPRNQLDIDPPRLSLGLPRRRLLSVEGNQAFSMVSVMVRNGEKLP